MEGFSICPVAFLRKEDQLISNVYIFIRSAQSMDFMVKNGRFVYTFVTNQS